MSTPPPAPPADTKDWTWVLEQRCPECGFEASGVPGPELADAIRRSTEAWADVLTRPDAASRPSATRWSSTEYAAHVRDVCRVFAQRLDLLLAEDDARFPSWDQDETALAERYWEQEPSVVAGEVRAAGDRLAQRYESIEPEQWSRSGRRGNGPVFTVETLGQYVLHDLEHHLYDVGAAGHR
jgi:hypothetical protein